MYSLKKEGLEVVPIWPPRSGLFQMMNSDGSRSAVAIWFGPPNDPLTGEELDRSPRWQALINGREIDPSEVWPYVHGREITPEDYNELRSLEQ